MFSGKLLVVCGKTKVGKSSVCSLVREELQARGEKALVLSQDFKIQKRLLEQTGIPLEIFQNHPHKILLPDEYPCLERPVAARDFYLNFLERDRLNFFYGKEISSEVKTLMQENPGAYIVVDGMRFKEEYFALEELNACFLRVSPYPGYNPGEIEDHWTEKVFDDQPEIIWDGVIELYACTSGRNPVCTFIPSILQMLEEKKS